MDLSTNFATIIATINDIRFSVLHNTPKAVVILSPYSPCLKTSALNKKASTAIAMIHAERIYKYVSCFGEARVFALLIIASRMMFNIKTMNIKAATPRKAIFVPAGLSMFLFSK